MNKKNKVGIVTLYHNNYNFGGLLQAYALPTALKKYLGIPAEQIDYLCNNGKPITSSKYIKNRNSFVFVSGILSKTSDFKIEKVYQRQKRAKISVSINGKNFKVFLPIEKSEL